MITNDLILLVILIAGAVWINWSIISRDLGWSKPRDARQRQLDNAKPNEGSTSSETRHSEVA
ncbi:MAG: hypothetical protein KDC54_00415 [Lewinella sp.]|nr:hypothetical protein [Lewinella sp.]